jgi:DNA/RNA-binding domain of Phe-tRNA-synthetase-like protein
VVSDHHGVFCHAEEILERFPTIHAGVIHATGLSNGPTPPALLGRISKSSAPRWTDWEVGVARRRALDRRLAAYVHGVRSQANAVPQRGRGAIPPADEARDIPSIGTLVDLGNLVSIRYAMPVAVVDLRAIGGSITMRFASGDERFTTSAAWKRRPRSPAR